MTANRKEGISASTEPVTIGELAPSASFIEELRRARDVLEGGRLARRMRETADGGEGISQQELARRLGVSQARISAVERGSGPQGPTYELLKRIGRACGIELITIFQQPTVRPELEAPAELQSAR